jgi:hypothetical protein
MSVAPISYQVASQLQHWGHPYTKITLSTNWQTFKVAIKDLHTETWFPDPNITWDQVKNKICGLCIWQYNNLFTNEYFIEIDYCKLIGMRYEDFGFTYKEP